MIPDLNQVQIRVLGCLIEKQLTTPDYYPLTLSALTNACNQKSNRDPVMSLTESDVMDAIQGLISLNMGREQQMAGARSLKYAHKLSGTLTKEFDCSQNELGVLSVLFVRGPQTVGEIRTRTARMCNFESLADVEATLNSLREKSSGPFVMAMAREPGRREIRHQHLFSTAPVEEQAAATEQLPNQTSSQTASQAIGAQTNTKALDELREEVSSLRADLDSLTDIVNQLLK